MAPSVLLHYGDSKESYTERGYFNMNIELRHEANFDDWCAFLDEECHNHGVSVTVDGLFTGRPKDVRKILRLIESNIHYGLLDRIPNSERKRCDTLIVSAKVLCKPFRLLDLPEGVRRNIYGFALYSDEPIMLWGKLGWIHESVSMEGTPALTRTSAQIHSEALPVWLSLKTFVFYFMYGPTGVENLHVKEIVASARAFKPFLKHLRRINMCYHWDMNYGEEISFTWTAEDGLSCVFKGDPKEKQKRERMFHVEYLRRYAEQNELEGEFVAMGSTLDREVWRELTPS